MPTKHTETQFKQKFLKAIKQRYPNCYVRKLSDRFNSGILDFVLCNNGWWVWLELKVLPRKVTPLQAEEIKKIRNAGGSAHSISAKPDFSVFYLDEVLFFTDLLTVLRRVL